MIDVPIFATLLKRGPDRRVLVKRGEGRPEKVGGVHRLSLFDGVGVRRCLRTPLSNEPLLTVSYQE